MNDIFAAYNLDIDDLGEFYRKLNEKITFADGMVTSLGIIYWGRDDHIPALTGAIPQLKAEGVHRFSELRDALRTPGRLKKFAQQTGLSPQLLRILQHDLDLWLPKAVPLADLEPFQEPGYLEKFAAIDISLQLQLISSGQTPSDRARLAHQTAIPLETMVELVKYCDMYRLGSNLAHIRTRLYCAMGLDTWQKWASLTSETIIAMFADYVRQHDLEAVRLVPWPKEVRNGIEWAKYHLSIFAVEWEEAR